jgi:hypothetical protein
MPQEHATRTRPRETSQGHATGTRHWDTPQGQATGTRQRDMPQGHSTGPRPGDMLQGHATSACHKDTPPGLSIPVLNRNLNDFFLSDSLFELHCVATNLFPVHIRGRPLPKPEATLGLPMPHGHMTYAKEPHVTCRSREVIVFGPHLTIYGGSFCPSKNLSVHPSIPLNPLYIALWMDGQNEHPYVMG